MTTTSERVADLLSKMTLKEKMGQLNQKMYGWQAYKKTADGKYELTESFKKEVEFGAGMGALYGLFRADPWSEVNFDNGISDVDSPHVANLIQKYIKENTRLGIPVFLSEECPHGHQALGSVMYPTNLGMGATFNPALQEKVSCNVSKELSLKGAHLGLVSTLDILRDPRWGRSEECFGEDPYLASCMTTSVTRGLNTHTTAVLKHYAAQGQPNGGHNAGAVPIGERELREIFLPAMKSGAAAGAKAVMAAYNDIDGIPCHANHHLLTEILRDEFKFDGFVMADGQALDHLVRLTGDREASAQLALHAGVDLSLWDNVYTKIEDGVNSGKIDIALVDRAVSRILKLKFELGLFDDEKRYVPETVSFDYASWREDSLQAARESLVLLKNENNLLPLSKDKKKIAVIGPNADALYNQLGDYTSPQAVGSGYTLLDGIKAVFSDCEVVYHKGCSLLDKDIHTEFSSIREACELAKSADVVILALGGASSRDFDMTFMGNGAVTSTGGNMDCGENIDVANLNLGGCQQNLAFSLSDANPNLITVLIQGRPYAISPILPYTPAVLCAWYPGALGGLAIAQTLAGENNPSGKLPVSIPRSSMGLPAYYNGRLTGAPVDYLDLKGTALFPFGYGLSYSRFRYDALHLPVDHLSLSEISAGRTFDVTITLTNTSAVTGQEVVQLYLFDEQSTIVTRRTQLKAFQKVTLAPNETKTVTLSLDLDALSVWDATLTFRPEVGSLKLMVGDSATTHLEGRVFITQ